MDRIPVQPEQARPALFPGAPAWSLAGRQDWSATPLGPVEAWPQSLKTAASMVLGSTVPMFVAWGPDMLLVYNDSYAEILGDRGPAFGRPVREIWSDAWDRIRPNTERAWAGETLFFESEPRTLRRDGIEQPIWLTFGYNPILGEDGHVAGLFGTVTAINRDAAAEGRVRESEERFRLIADSAPVPMWVTKLDRRRSFVNRAYLEFMGVTYEEAIELDWRNIIHPDDIDRIIAESIAGEASLKSFLLEGRFRRGRDGQWRWLRSISQPRWGPSGEHAGFIGVAHDITDWKLANELLEARVAERTADLSAALDRLQAEVGERERAEAALRQAQKMEAVGQLTGGIAHDFNNLLTPVIGGLEILVRGVEEPRLKRVAEAALESGRRGAKLTTQLLAFSRTQRMRMAPVAVNKVIGTMISMLRHALGGAVAVETRLGDVGRALCDENQLENAILNLAINARDAMPDGGTLTISTALVHEADGPDLAAGGYARIAIADTGLGMSAEVAARATEPFFSTKPFGKGTGLGLAQVYGICRQSGGTLRIESREGEGTTVALLLPHVAGEMSAEAAASGDEAAEQEVPAAPAARIMVVDDDADVRLFLADILADLGHRVDTLDCAEAALAALAAAAPDLVLIDFAMPGMNGAELARETRLLHPDLPIVFVTGFAESDQLESALGSDVPVLRKPFGIDELAAVVAAYVGARDPMKQAKRPGS